jgi:hypothetical protein
MTMFERLRDRARRLAEARAETIRKDVAERLSREMPGGIDIRLDAAGVRVSGRGLKRRLVLNPALRALVGRLR